MDLSILLLLPGRLTPRSAERATEKTRHQLSLCLENQTTTTLNI